MEEFFSNEGEKFTRISDGPNVEAFEILEVWNKVQCEHWLKFFCLQDPFVAVVNDQVSFLCGPFCLLN